jgi:hypothetical protein
MALLLAVVVDAGCAHDQATRRRADIAFTAAGVAVVVATLVVFFVYFACTDPQQCRGGD